MSLKQYLISFHFNVNLLYHHALICYRVELKQILSKFNMFILKLAVFLCTNNSYVSVVSGTFKDFIYKLNIVLLMFYFNFLIIVCHMIYNFVFSGVLSLTVQTLPLLYYLFH